MAYENVTIFGLFRLRKNSSKRKYSILIDEYTIKKESPLWKKEVKTGDIKFSIKDGGKLLNSCELFAKAMEISDIPPTRREELIKESLKILKKVMRIIWRG